MRDAQKFTFAGVALACSIAALSAATAWAQGTGSPSAIAEPAARSSQSTAPNKPKVAELPDGKTGPASGSSLNDPTLQSEPDPLTPTKAEQGPLTAPGAPAAAVVKAPLAPGETDPIVQAVQQKLAAADTRLAAGEREDRAALTSFYGETGRAAVWTDKAGLTARGKAAVAEIQKAGDWGLEASAFALPEAPSAGSDPSALAEAEIKISAAVLKYARHARGGRVDPQSLSKNIDQQVRLYEPRSVINAIAASDEADGYLRRLHPQHAGFQNLRKALLIARGAGTVAASTAPVADAEPEETPTKSGRGKKTSEKAGKSATKNSGDVVQRILVNMERWRWMPDDLGAFHVFDNVPEQHTRVVKDGKVILKEKIVVGKPSTPTPQFSADMKFVIFHPTWGVPEGIKTNELAPMLRRAAASNNGWLFGDSDGASRALSRHNLVVTHNGRPVNPDSVNWSSVDVRQFAFTQPASGRNVLGQVKFRFPNRFDVYMHDTPEKHLFANGTRAFSHGCMRVQNPLRLAEVLLEHDKGWGADKIQSLMARGQTTDVTLSKSIPVHITYFTATADDDGTLHSHGDLYGMDGRVASAMAGKTIHLASAPAVNESAASEQGTRREARRPARSANGNTKVTKSEPFNPFSGLFAN